MKLDTFNKNKSNQYPKYTKQARVQLEYSKHAVSRVSTWFASGTFAGLGFLSTKANITNIIPTRKFQYKYKIEFGHKCSSLIFCWCTHQSPIIIWWRFDRSELHQNLSSDPNYQITLLECWCDNKGIWCPLSCMTEEPPVEFRVYT